MRKYYIDADELIDAVKIHKEKVKLTKDTADSWMYEKAHDHIIEIIEIFKKFAITLDRDD